MFYGKPDAVQEAIVKELRQNKELSVWITSGLRKGYPDINVGITRYNIPLTFIFEIKNSEKDKLTEAELKFQEKWKGQYAIITSAQEIMEYIDKFYATLCQRTRTFSNACIEYPRIFETNFSIYGNRRPSMYY